MRDGARLTGANDMKLDFATMKIRLAAALVACLALVGGAHAQVSVQTDSEAVAVDRGGIVVEDADDRVTIDGDWRRGGSVRIDDGGASVLVDLGGVVVGDRIQVNLEGDVLFDFDSSALAPAAKARLAKVAALVRARAVGAVHVIGHTDALGGGDYNERLSRERAQAVIRFLREAEGIPGALLVGHGVGARHPVAANTRSDGSDNPAGRARNRRVEIQIATREGVSLGPDQVIVAPDRIVTAEASIDAGGVSTDEARVDIGSDGVRVTEHVAGGNVTEIVGEAMATAGLSGKVATQPMAGGACELMCQSSTGRQSLSTIECIEETLEELDFDFDADACDAFEDAMATGAGNYGGQQCRNCRKAEGYGDAHCLKVVQACLTNKH
ncbi:MAG: hypothetical protein AMXMBFR25_31880 [Lysobacterales bacterium]